MIRKVIESGTLAGVMFLLAGTDSSILCGVAGLVLLLIFRWQINAWEEGE